MRKLLIVFCLYCCSLCYGQDRKFDFGLSAPLFAKYNTLQHTQDDKKFLGCIGINGFARVNGTEESKMAFMLSAGLMDDYRSYYIDESSKIVTDLISLNINPSVIIPSKWDHVYYNFGIGAIVRLTQGFSYSESSTYGYLYSNADSIEHSINNSASKIVPYVSLGILADINPRFQVQFTVEPTLLSFYEFGTTIHFNSNTSAADISLAYQPIYVGLKLFYFFRPKG